MTKRNRQRIKERNSDEEIEIIGFIKVILVVIVCIAGIYLFTRIFVTKDLLNKDKKEDEVAEEAKINYDFMNLGMMFNRPYTEYYALLYDADASNAGYYTSVGSNYAGSEKSIKIYFVDLNSPFNQAYVSEETNPAAKTASELKVKFPTLIKIKNGKIVKYLEDKDKITEELKVTEK